MAFCAVDVLLGCSSFTDELAVAVQSVTVSSVSCSSFTDELAVAVAVAVHSVTVSSVIFWQFAGWVLLQSK